MPAVDQPQDNIYAAFVERFKNQGLNDVFLESLVVGQEVPGTNFPYCLMSGQGEPIVASSTRTEYANPDVQLTVYGKTWSDVRYLIGLVKRAFRWAPMPLTGLEGPHATLSVMPGPIHYLQEDMFWKAMIDFEVVTAETVSRNPAPGQRA